MDWDKICIRANVDGKWGSYTLNELWGMGGGDQIYEWCLTQLNGLEGVTLTKENLDKLIEVMKSFGVQIVKLK